MKFSSLTHHLETIHTVMYDMPGNFYIKDLQGNYLYLNKNTELAAGFSLLGKTDFSAPWDRYARWYQRCDRMTVELNQPRQSWELIKDHRSEIDPLVSHKKPFYHNGELIGTSGMSLVIPNEKLVNNTSYNKHIFFFDLISRRELILTPRQHQILYWLLQGWSARDISDRFAISKRTVEHHISSIRDENGYDSLKEILLQVRAL